MDKTKPPTVGLMLHIMQASELQIKVAYVARVVKVLDGNFLSTNDNLIDGLSQEEKPSHSSSLDPMHARLEGSRDLRKGPEEEDLLQMPLMQECLNLRSSALRTCNCEQLSSLY
jgi:hypothetical protein